MLKRVVITAAVGVAVVFALPTFAMGQEEQGSTETSSTTSEPATEVDTTTEVTAVTEETTEAESTEDTSGEIELQTAPAADSSTTTTASTAANSTASTQTSLTTAKKSSGKKKKGRKSSKKSCSASSRAGGPLAQASAPVAPGCFRNDPPEGPLELPDGTILNITLGDEGVINFTVTGGPTGTFSGTIFVKGGPNAQGAGFACVFNGVTAGTCHANVNPNNGKFYGVSHVDACPGTFVPPGDQPGDDDRSEGKERDKKVAGGRRQKEATTVAAGETVTPQGETLPFTGLPVAWLLIVGAALISGGLATRRSA
jgi:hypothetical protein